MKILGQVLTPLVLPTRMVMGKTVFQLPVLETEVLTLLMSC